MSAALQWKREALSPIIYDEVLVLTSSFYHTPSDKNEKIIDVNLNGYQFDSIDSKAEVASQILENLENLMDLDDLIKDEPFLLDEKMLPLLEEVQPPCAVAVPVHFKAEQYHDNFAYDLVELNAKTSAALTPPQTPPRDHAMLTDLDSMVQQENQAIYINQSPLDLEKTAIYSVPDKQFTSGLSRTFSNQFVSANTHNYEYASNHDLAHELAVVDELVRTRVENMHWTSSGPSSPDSSSQSNFGDYSSSDDPEWVSGPNGTDQNSLAIPGTYTKKTKYFKGTEEKRSRKKEQNKNAATRYRLKKKAEVEEILNEEKGLLAANNILNSKVTDIQREIKYLKGLMRDLCKAKKIIT